eukprot:symbB.v1.2.034210.t1/scaffold4379.1/size40462/2
MEEGERGRMATLEKCPFWQLQCRQPVSRGIGFAYLLGALKVGKRREGPWQLTSPQFVLPRRCFCAADTPLKASLTLMSPAGLSVRRGKQHLTPFDSNLSARKVRKVTCLGSSFHAALVFDPEEIMPETFWAAVETVQGGGIVCIVPETSAGDRHNFFGRLMKNLEEAWRLPALEPLQPIGSEILEHPQFAEEQEPRLEEIGSDVSAELQALLALTCNNNQRQVLATAFKELQREGAVRPQVVITGRRGRGKLGPKVSV